MGRIIKSFFLDVEAQVPLSSQDFPAVTSWTVLGVFTVHLMAPTNLIFVSWNMAETVTNNIY